jgi:hypothetical protein
MVHVKAIYYTQGRDTGNVSFGANILKPSVPPFRTNEYGYEVGSGVNTKVAYGSLLLSYELRPNLFIEATAVYRREAALGQSNSTMIGFFGIRWNMQRREFDF